MNGNWYEQFTTRLGGVLKPKREAVSIICRSCAWGLASDVPPSAFGTTFVGSCPQVVDTVDGRQVVHCGSPHVRFHVFGLPFDGRWHMLPAMPVLASPWAMAVIGLHSPPRDVLSPHCTALAVASQLRGEWRTNVRTEPLGKAVSTDTGGTPPQSHRMHIAYLVHISRKLYAALVRHDVQPVIQRISGASHLYL